MEKELTISDSEMPANAPQEMYENKRFELNSTERDSVFDQQRISEDSKMSHTMDDFNTESQQLDVWSDI